MIFPRTTETGDRTLLEKTIRLRPESSLRRVKTREPPTQRGKEIIEIARAELRRHIS